MTATVSQICAATRSIVLIAFHALTSSPLTWTIAAVFSLLMILPYPAADRRAGYYRALESSIAIILGAASLAGAIVHPLFVIGVVAVPAYRRLKFRFGRDVTLIALYAID